MRDLDMTLPALGLAHDFAVPFEAEPSQPVDDRGDCLGRRSLAVGVFQPKPEAAAVVARV